MVRRDRQQTWEERRYWEGLDQVPRWVERRIPSRKFRERDSNRPKHYILTGRNYHYRISEVSRHGQYDVVVERSPRGKKGRLFDRQIQGDPEDRPGFWGRLFGRG